MPPPPSASVLVLYGLAIAAGNIIGGRVADRNPVKALTVLFAAQAAVLVIFTFTSISAIPALDHARSARLPVVRQCARPAALCGAIGQAAPSRRRRCRLGAQHRRLQPRYRCRCLDRRTGGLLAARAAGNTPGSARSWSQAPWCSPSSAACSTASRSRLPRLLDAGTACHIYRTSFQTRPFRRVSSLKGHFHADSQRQRRQYPRSRLRHLPHARPRRAAHRATGDQARLPPYRSPRRSIATKPRSGSHPGIRAARGDIFLTTKVWVDNYKHDAFLASVDESLKKLRTDYVDLLLLHWPSSVRAAGRADRRTERCGRRPAR